MPPWTTSLTRLLVPGMSFLIPIGIGVDYALSKQIAITADFLLNLTSLGDDVRVGGREVDLHTNIMPALYFEVRF